MGKIRPCWDKIYQKIKDIKKLEFQCLCGQTLREITIVQDHWKQGCLDIEQITQRKKWKKTCNCGKKLDWKRCIWCLEGEHYFDVLSDDNLKVMRSFWFALCECGDYWYQPNAIIFT